MKMLNAHHGMTCYEDSIRLRSICKNEYRAVEKEWTTCPKCKNKRLIPINKGKNAAGKVWIWWMCENIAMCLFPLDMPARVFHTEQTAEQAASGFFPLPRINELPQQFYHLYPVTFASHSNQKRSGSSASVQRSTCDSSSSSSTDTNQQVNNDEPSCSTSEEIANVEDQGYEIESEEMELQKKKRPIRTVKRDGYFDTDKSWSKLIKTIAESNQDYSSFLNIDEKQLMTRVKNIIEEVEVTRHPISLTRKYRRKTMKLDEHETAMRQYPLSVKWGVAREKLLEVDIPKKVEVRAARDNEKMLKVLGVDIPPGTSNLPSCDEVMRERAKVLSGRIDSVLKKMHNREDVDERVKRQKLETERRRQNLSESRKNAVKSMAKSRVLERLSNLERPTPSITPYSSVASPSYETMPSYEAMPSPHPPPANYVANEFSLNLSGLHDDYQHPIQPTEHATVDSEVVQEEGQGELDYIHREQEGFEEDQHQQPQSHDDLGLNDNFMNYLDDDALTGVLDDDLQQQNHHFGDHNDDNNDDYQDFQF